jgi:hypothetical protein
MMSMVPPTPPALPPPAPSAPAQATPAAPPGLTLTEEQIAQWRQRLDASKRVIDDRRDKSWKKNTTAYMGRVLDKLPKDHTVNVPLEFAFVESKKAQLAFQVPEVHLAPKLPGLEAAVSVFQPALNHELGDHGANVKQCVDEILTDTLLCGIGASKIAYLPHIRSRPKMGPGPVDPLTGQPGLLAPVTDPTTGEPMQEQYLAGEEYRWDRFPVEDLLIPIEFEQSDCDRAPWLGARFRMPLDRAKEQFALPDDFSAVKAQLRETLSSDEQPGRAAGNTTIQEIEGYEIWLQADVFDPTALPGQYRKLVLIDGHDGVAEYKDSPYQWVTEDGKLKGMVGNPIHPLTLRFLPGSAYPVGDVEIARPISEELSKGRTQMIQFRDRVMPFIGINREKCDPETKQKIEDQTVGRTIGFDGDPNEVVRAVSVGQFPRENFTFNQISMDDYKLVWRVGPNAVGQVEPEARTATEVQNARGEADVVLDAERTAVLRWFTRGAAKFASLLQQFKDDQSYVEITGQDGAKNLQAWDRRHIQGEFVFTAKPDSALRIDADVERRQALALYNLLGRDPNVNRTELLKTVLLRHNMDPSKIVVATPPPAPHPEPPKISLAFKGEDLGNPMVLAILQQLGLTLPTPQELAGIPGPPQQPGAPPGQPPAPPGMAPHPGATPQAEPLNKHALQQQTGKVM